MSELTREQPKPKRNDHPGVWPLVIADVQRHGLTARLVVALVNDMEARNAIGIQRYGTPLQPHNGRDALVDAYQEALDGAVYLRQAIAEGVAAAEGPYILARELLIALRRALLERDGR